MTGGGDRGLEIEGSHSQVPEEWVIEEAKKKADEQATKRALDIKAKWALRQMRRRERAEFFARPYWRAKTVLNWIAFRKPTLIDVELLDAIPLYGNTGWNRFMERQPGRALLRALRSGSINATGSDGAAVHTAKWNRWSTPLDLNDYRAWALFDFEREKVLEVFPADQQADKLANLQMEAVTGEDQQSAVAAAHKAAMPSFEELKSFAKENHDVALASGTPTNRETAGKKANLRFGIGTCQR